MHKNIEKTANNQDFKKESYPIFSFFIKPITNINPSRTVSLIDIYKYIQDERLKPVTNNYRSLKEGKNYYKSHQFNYVTFSGVFTKRSNEFLVNHSGYICIDFDNVQVEPLFDKLKQNEHTELMFRSPSGDGIKWVVSVDIENEGHCTYFNAISEYVKQEYQIEIDQSGKDIARACFICYDENVFINPKYVSHV